MLIGLLSALLATVLNTVAGLLQSDATTHVRRGRPLAVQPRYLVGLLVDGLGWVATVLALRHLPVFAVQAILGGAIALTALATDGVPGSRCTARTSSPSWGAYSACCWWPGAPVVTGPVRSGPSPTSCWAARWSCCRDAGGLRNCRAAWPFALVAGLGFGGTSLAVRAVHVSTGPALDPGVLVAEPAVYLVLGYFLIGLISYSRALGRGDIAGVTAVFAITEVVVPGLIGIALLGDPVRAGWWWVLALGLVMAVAGMIRLARLPPARRRADRPR